MIEEEGEEGEIFVGDDTDNKNTKELKQENK